MTGRSGSADAPGVDSFTLSYDCDARDRLTRISQSGRLRTFEDDGRGRLWRRAAPGQGLTAYAHNADGASGVVAGRGVAPRPGVACPPGQARSGA